MTFFYSDPFLYCFCFRFGTSAGSPAYLLWKPISQQLVLIFIRLLRFLQCGPQHKTSLYTPYTRGRSWTRSGTTRDYWGTDWVSILFLDLNYFYQCVDVYRSCKLFEIPPNPCSAGSRKHWLSCQHVRLQKILEGGHVRCKSLLEGDAHAYWYIL